VGREYENSDDRHCALTERLKVCADTHLVVRVTSGLSSHGLPLLSPTITGIGG